MTTIIAIDAMSGDIGVDATVEASVFALKKHVNLQLILVGNQEIIQKKLDELHVNANLQASEYKDRLSIHHASEVVAMDESPSKALRAKKDSSMRVAINLVRNGVASACVSAGNTGALMATARFVLKTLSGIDRPAIVTKLPTLVENKYVYMLDLGANVDCDAKHLYEFAVMGSVLVSSLMSSQNDYKPTVGLLNIGSEEIKGNEQVKQASQLIQNNPAINYVGYVEGDGIFKGNIDVVVCDGFSGNVALKTIEGVVKLIFTYMKRCFTKNLFTKIIALLVKPILRSLVQQLDPGRHNGASLIGLQGIVIKSHGGANAFAFSNAIEEAICEVEHNVPQRIKEQVANLL